MLEEGGQRASDEPQWNKIKTPSPANRLAVCITMTNLSMKIQGGLEETYFELGSWTGA